MAKQLIPLDYATPGRSLRPPAQFDLSALTLASLQILVALFFLVTFDSTGYSELDPAQPWYVKLIWRLSSGRAILMAYAFFSAFVIIGAVRKPSRRFWWYVIYTTGFFLISIMFLASGFVLDGVRERWVSLYGGKQPWKANHADMEELWAIPLWFVAFNPVLVLWAVRLFRRIGKPQNE